MQTAFAFYKKWVRWGKSFDFLGKYDKIICSLKSDVEEEY